MAYASRADLVAASTVAELTGASVAQQDGWYAEAKRAVEAFCGQRFDLVSEARTLDGNGALRLPLESRLATLSALTIDDVAIDLADVALTTRRDAIKMVRPRGGNWVERALREWSGERWGFSYGFANVVVTGDWGWTAAEMPATADAPVGAAMRLDMEDQALAATHGLAKTVRAQARLGLDSVAEGPLSAQITRPEVPLSVDAQYVLEPYIWQPAPAVV